MFTTSRSYVTTAAASLFVLALLAMNVQAQPTFPGFPGGGTSGSGGVYTPFNPLAGAMSTNGPGALSPGYYPPYPYYPQYYMDPVGSFLYGTSAVIGSVGKYQMNVESAQIMHQMALQKQIETTKMMFDLEKYIRENTPSFTDNQIKIAKETLKRILVNATPGEIANGNALNVLLKDLTKQTDLEKITHGGKIPEITLRSLNIVDAKGRSLGVLKNYGKFVWPIALTDEKLISKDERDSIVILTEQAVTLFLNSGAPDEKTYKDLKAYITKLMQKLSERVLTIETPDYLQAKRFLESFDSALMSMQTPQVAAAFKAYQQFIKPGRTVPELVAYLKGTGLSFGPALPGDESAYEVLYSALASYDLMYNTQLVSGKKQ